MKKFIVLLLVLSPICGFAQTAPYIDSPINRIDNQNGNIIYWNAEFEGTTPLLHQPTPQSESSFSITMTDGNTLSFKSGTLGVLMGTIHNLTLAPVRIKFIRSHLRLSPFWTSSICFGANCYAPKTDSIDDDAAYEVPPNGDPGEFRLNIECPAKASDSSIDYIRFIAVGTTDTMTLILIAKATPQAGVNDLQPKQLGANPKITSIYPSPLVQGSSIKVKVTSPRESSISYSIFDNVGREVGLGATRQHIGLGDNTIEIRSLDGLANGSYMLKLKFSDGSSDTHFFQVLK